MELDGNPLYQNWHEAGKFRYLDSLLLFDDMKINRGFNVKFDKVIKLSLV
jgi:hypothetical protein